MAIRVDAALRPVVDRPFLRRVVRAALASEECAAGYAVDLRITDDAGIQRLNAEYRGVDAPTDVLSFPLQPLAAGHPAGEEFVLPPDEPVHLGDIVLSWPRAEAQAVEYGHSLPREVAFLLVHGVLHLLGYDHEDPVDAARMRPREEAILADLGLLR